MIKIFLSSVRFWIILNLKPLKLLLLHIFEFIVVPFIILFLIYNYNIDEKYMCDFFGNLFKMFSIMWMLCGFVIIFFDLKLFKPFILLK